MYISTLNQIDNGHWRALDHEELCHFVSPGPPAWPSWLLRLVDPPGSNEGRRSRRSRRPWSPEHVGGYHGNLWNAHFLKTQKGHKELPGICILNFSLFVYRKNTSSGDKIGGTRIWFPVHGFLLTLWTDCPACTKISKDSTTLLEKNGLGYWDMALLKWSQVTSHA